MSGASNPISGACTKRIVIILRLNRDMPEWTGWLLKVGIFKASCQHTSHSLEDRFSTTVITIYYFLISAILSLHNAS